MQMWQNTLDTWYKSLKARRPIASDLGPVKSATGWRRRLVLPAGRVNSTLEGGMEKSRANANNGVANVGHKKDSRVAIPKAGADTPVPKPEEEGVG